MCVVNILRDVGPETHAKHGLKLDSGFGIRIVSGYIPSRSEAMMGDFI